MAALSNTWVDNSRTTLRKKTLLIMGLTFAGLFGMLYSASRVVMLRSFAKLEEQDARQNLERALSALSDDLSALDQTTGDYSEWNRTYNFAVKPDPKYAISELPDGMLTRYRLNAILIFNSSGRLLVSKGFDPNTSQAIPVSKSLMEHLAYRTALLQHGDTRSRITGILLLPEAPMLIASRPILTAEGNGPIHGTVIMGRFLDAAEMDRLEAITHLPLALCRLDDSRAPSDFEDAKKSLGMGQSTLIRPLSADSIGAYHLLQDIYGKPALILNVTLPREIYHQGHASLLQLALSLLGSGFVFGAVTLVLFEKMLLSRVIGLSASVKDIGARGDLSARVSLPGRDELSNLGGAINHMLEALEKSQEDQHVSEKRFRTLIENSSDMIALVTADGTVSYASPSTVRILGYPFEEFVGRKVFELVHMEDRTNIDNLLAGILREPENAASAEFRLLHKDGSWRWIEGSWNNFLSEPDIGSIVVNYHDISGRKGVEAERRQLEDQLRQAQKMEAVGRLAGGVAHDFNNLLMVIQGQSEIILQRLKPQEALISNVEEIRQAAGRAASLTRQLLAFSRMQVLQPKVLDLNAVLTDIGRMLPRLIPESIELSILPCVPLGQVKADQNQIEQVIINLAVNARDAMPQGGKLTITTENVYLDEAYAKRHSGLLPGPYVMLAVSDTGVGMDQETQRHIFEPFFTTKALGKGTGLGLATVYGVVKQSGGWIWVYSELGRGSRFKIYLPCVEETVHLPAVSKTVEVVRRGSETILLAEDQEGVRDLISEFLVSNGYTILTASNGEEALEVAQRHDGPIHLLLTDVMMPKMSGHELARRLAQVRSETSVLYMSGYSDYAAPDHPSLDSTIPTLEKPFALNNLAYKLREVLEKPAYDEPPTRKT